MAKENQNLSLKNKKNNLIPSLNMTFLKITVFPNRNEYTRMEMKNILLKNCVKTIAYLRTNLMERHMTI